MAITASGLFFITIEGLFRNTIGTVNLEAEDNKLAMFTNSITPNFDTNTVYGSAPYNANEVSGTGYTAGGQLVTTTELTVSAGTMIYSADDVEWAASTITNARGGLLYADAASNEAILLVDFGADYSTTSGLFSIQWNSGRIFTLDLTP